MPRSVNMPLKPSSVRLTTTLVDTLSAFACASLVIQMIVFTSPSPHVIQATCASLVIQMIVFASPSPHVIQATKIPTPITPSATFVIKREKRLDQPLREDDVVYVKASLSRQQKLSHCNPSMRFLQLTM